MTAAITDIADVVSGLIGDAADGWDLAGQIPHDTVRALAAAGVLCTEVPVEHGGLGLSSLRNGELTAHVGSLCSSARSLMTSHGMAAWAVYRLGSTEQRAAYLPRFTSGSVAGVAFSEPDAGSDLSAMRTTIRHDGDSVVVSGHKTWVTAAAYADTLLVFGRHGDSGSAAVLVPTDAPGVDTRQVPDPMGCRAAGHADVWLHEVRLPAGHLLGGAGLPVDWLVTPVLTYGRLSVAWGCVGILRACLRAAAGHAARRQQFGKPIAEHQLVARHVAELMVAEQTATRMCEHASRCCDAGTPDLAPAVVVAKQVAAGAAARGAASAVQVLASAGARDGHPVARAYRDAKLMEIIEGSTEIGQLMLAKQAMAVWT